MFFIVLKFTRAWKMIQSLALLQQVCRIPPHYNCSYVPLLPRKLTPTKIAPIACLLLLWLLHYVERVDQFKPNQIRYVDRSFVDAASYEK